MTETLEPFDDFNFCDPLEELEWIEQTCIALKRQTILNCIRVASSICYELDYASYEQLPSLMNRLAKAQELLVISMYQYYV